MDSQERDQRATDGFGERGEILYDADERDERNKYREAKKIKRKEKDQQTAGVFAANEYGLDDDEAEDIEDLPGEDESHSNERGLDDEG
jgi:hypothetical protein